MLMRIVFAAALVVVTVATHAVGFDALLRAIMRLHALDMSGFPRVTGLVIGIGPQISDADLVTLAVMQALLGFTSEARWIRHAHQHLGHLFRYLPRQPGYNKRLRRSATLITRIIRMLAMDAVEDIVAGQTGQNVVGLVADDIITEGVADRKSVV